MAVAVDELLDWIVTTARRVGASAVRLGLDEQNELGLTLELGGRPARIRTYPATLFAPLARRLAMLAGAGYRQERVELSWRDGARLTLVREGPAAPALTLELPPPTATDLSALDEGDGELVEALVKELGAAAEARTRELLAPANEELELEGDFDELPTVRLVNVILLNAARKRASRVFIDVTPGRVLVRYEYADTARVEHEMLPPAKLGPVILRRLLVMAGLDPFSWERPQRGAFTLVFDSGKRGSFSLLVRAREEGEQAILDVPPALWPEADGTGPYR